MADIQTTKAHKSDDVTLENGAAQHTSIYIVLQPNKLINEERFKNPIPRKVGLILSSIQAIVAFLAIVFQVMQ